MHARRCGETALGETDARISAFRSVGSKLARGRPINGSAQRDRRRGQQDPHPGSASFLKAIASRSLALDGLRVLDCGGLPHVEGSCARQVVRDAGLAADGMEELVLSFAVDAAAVSYRRWRRCVRVPRCRCALRGRLARVTCLGIESCGRPTSMRSVSPAGHVMVRSRPAWERCDEAEWLEQLHRTARWTVIGAARPCCGSEARVLRDKQAIPWAQRWVPGARALAVGPRRQSFDG